MKAKREKPSLQRNDTQRLIVELKKEKPELREVYSKVLPMKQEAPPERGGSSQLNKELFHKFVERYKENTEKLEQWREEAIQLMEKLFGFSAKQIRNSFDEFLHDYN